MIFEIEFICYDPCCNDNWACHFQKTTAPFLSGNDRFGIRQRFVHFRAIRLPAHAIHSFEGVNGAVHIRL